MKTTLQKIFSIKAAQGTGIALSAALLMGSVTGLSGQDASLEEMLKEMQAMRTRMAELEAQVNKLKRQAAETEEALDEVFSPAFMAEGLPKNVTRGFEFKGYLRAGYMINQDGRGVVNANEEFVHPDGLFETGWRLGNEADTYGELTTIYNYPFDSGPNFQFVSTLAFKYQGNKNNYTTAADDGTDLLIREAYVRADNVLAGNPEVAFWAGQRFYDRHDIHINDLFFLDMSGFGGGVENIPVGPGNLNLAYIIGTQTEQTRGSEWWNTGPATEHHFDIRYKGLKALGGELMLWGDLAVLNAGIEQAGANGKTRDIGWALGLVHFKPLAASSTITGGFNKFSLMYGKGNASDFNAYVLDWRNIDAIKNSEGLRLTNQTVLQFSERTSLMAALVYDYSDLGDGYTASSTDRTYISAGVRPIHMITDYVGIQGEFGIDWVDDIRWTPEKDKGTLYKLTIAPTIRPGGSFFARPEIRLFATYAWWNKMPDWFNPAHSAAGASSAWTYGIQTETWW